MKLTRRALGPLILSLIAMAGWQPAAAAEYPEKPIRMVVPFVPGGPINLLGRPLADALAKELGQPVIVDNRPGANGIVGSTAVARSAPDGYTMLMTTGSFTANPFAVADLPYDPLTSFAPITQIASTYGIVMLVRPDFPAKSVADLVALAKKEGGNLTYAHAGVGNATHVGAELFLRAAGIQMIPVPYKGAGAFLSDIISGQVSMGMTSTVASVPYVRSGQLRALATTGTDRAPSLPEVPSLYELGYKEAVLLGYYGLWFPKDTPRDRVMRMQRAVSKVLDGPEMQKVMETAGITKVASSPEEFAAFLAKDLEFNREIMKAIGVEAK
jgi:tripartite-type tricarboxylate transporter receptor subunit TctC